MKRVNRTRFIVGSVVGIIILLAVLASQNEGKIWWPSVRLYDTTPQGGRALGMVMEKMGYTTRVQYDPLSQMPTDARVWFLINYQTTFSDRETDALLGWVRKGGILFWVPPDNSTSIFGDSSSHPGVDALQRKLGVGRSGNPTFDQNNLPKMSPLNLDTVTNYREDVKNASSTGTSLTFEPSRDASFTAGPRLPVAVPPGSTIARFDVGQGHIFVFPDAWTLSNYGLSKPANATLIANMARVHQASANSGTAYFDERQHNNELAPPMPDDWPARLRQKPVVYAVWQLIIVGLGALALVSRRLGEAVPLPSTAPVTRASGFAHAMGGLLLKATRPKAASQIIGESFRARLARRVGLSPRESDEVLAARAHEISGIDRNLLSRALIASRAPATDENSALRDAQQMERILEQLG